MPNTFDDWKRRLFASAGSAKAPLEQIGDYVLQLFWQDGCEPTMTAMLEYAEVGLCKKYKVEVGEEERAAI